MTGAQSARKVHLLLEKFRIHLSMSLRALKWIIKDLQTMLGTIDFTPVSRRVGSMLFFAGGRASTTKELLQRLQLEELRLKELLLKELLLEHLWTSTGIGKEKTPRRSAK